MFPAVSLGFTTFWVKFLCMWPFFDPTIEVVTFHLRWWCMLGVFFCCQHSPVMDMDVRIFWVRAMKCMCAQTRPQFILSLNECYGNFCCRAEVTQFAFMVMCCTIEVKLVPMIFRWSADILSSCRSDLLVKSKRPVMLWSSSWCHGQLERWHCRAAWTKTAIGRGRRTLAEGCSLRWTDTALNRIESGMLIFRYFPFFPLVLARFVLRRSVFRFFPQLFFLCSFSVRRHAHVDFQLFSQKSSGIPVE